MRRPRLHLSFISSKTRMTTYISEAKKTDDQTKIDTYRVAANITEYHIISKLSFQNS